MLKELHLRNYKCFAEQKIGLKPLTLLSGLNGTGKSSTLQSLLLLRQSYQQGVLQSTGLALNGELVHVGTAHDALFENAAEDAISINISLSDGKQGNWHFLYDDPTEQVLRTDPATLINDAIYQINLFSNDFHYLMAERIGPRRFFEMSNFHVHQQHQIGPAGEYAAHFVSVYADQRVHSTLIHSRALALTLKGQVEAWLGEISPDTRVSVTPSTNTDTIGLQYGFTDDALSRPYRATNVGFGITYAFPILVAVLSSQPGALILLENPEAHLHPRGQSQMGRLLALAASCGIQVIIETHSDHVLNGIRLAVHDGELAPEDVRIHYFQRDRGGQTQILSPQIDRRGRIDRWPDGFFDAFDKDLAALLLPPRSVSQ